MRIKRTVVSCLAALTLLGSSASAMSAQATCPPHHFADRVYQQTTSYTRSHNKELSTNNCCKFMAIFIVFPGFCLKQLQQLFSDNS